MDPGDVLTVDEVAGLIQIHRETVYTLIERGEIPAVKVGTRWRIRRRDVEALLTGEASWLSTPNPRRTSSVAPRMLHR